GDVLEPLSERLGGAAAERLALALAHLADHLRRLVRVHPPEAAALFQRVQHRAVARVLRARLLVLGDLLVHALEHLVHPLPESARLRPPHLPAPHAALDEVIHAALHVDRKSTRLDSSHVKISYAVFCLKKKTM